MKTGTRTAAALALLLGLSTGGAMAQPATSLGAFAPPTGQGHASRDVAYAQRPLTVMGMTGGIEPKYTETTGSITGRPVGQHPMR